ncbi:transcription factor Opi1-domain-containing protein [Polychytrium aggregatum]|uniref:transcription factor Opi1-domain-containing protein n=1 Tax=Polychytrium aggregatum TaxID=110093 RepID=UPI0022FE372E|nr:transcription factor Opi1-domain-containing protein [Polychytrium aggregatum]KAI9205729.1 transcription factor Opi1-domain-containing protein [Polychytrium aggregatum]
METSTSCTDAAPMGRRDSISSQFSTTSQRSMRVHDLCNHVNEDERLAAEVLQGLRTSEPATAASPHFLQRVTSMTSSLPLLRGPMNSIRAATDAATDAIKYGADAVESMSKPVLHMIPRLRSMRSISSFTSALEPQTEATKPEDSGADNAAPTAASPSVVLPPLSDEPVSLADPELHLPPIAPDMLPRAASPMMLRKNRNTWHQMMADLSTNLSAWKNMAISEETMRALRYCLDWLKYAAMHIENQIKVLRAYLARTSSRLITFSSTQLTPPLSPQNQHQMVAYELMQTALVAKREIANTLRKVVDVICRYAAVYMPAVTRRVVRDFIMDLPMRISSLNASAPVPMGADGTPNYQEAETIEAERVLVIATESKDMLVNLGNIFEQALTGADIIRRRMGASSSSADAMSVGTASVMGDDEPVSDKMALDQPADSAEPAAPFVGRRRRGDSATVLIPNDRDNKLPFLTMTSEPASTEPAGTSSMDIDTI